MDSVRKSVRKSDRISDGILCGSRMSDEEYCPYTCSPVAAGTSLLASMKSPIVLVPFRSVFLSQQYYTHMVGRRGLCSFVKRCRFGVECGCNRTRCGRGGLCSLHCSYTASKDFGCFWKPNVGTSCAKLYRVQTGLDSLTQVSNYNKFPHFVHVSLSFYH